MGVIVSENASKNSKHGTYYAETEGVNLIVLKPDPGVQKTPRILGLHGRDN